jgi:hypothetical protein
VPPGHLHVKHELQELRTARRKVDYPEWKLLHRQPIYEKDRIDPVDPTAMLKLDPQALATFPEGYRHLAYIQTCIGNTVEMDMPMLKGHVVEELYRRGARWLPGGALER